MGIQKRWASTRLWAVALVAVFPAGFLTAQTVTLDPAQFVVMGEGLAAGMGDFALHDVYQRNSFPALIAQRLGGAFPTPFIQSPGIGDVPGNPVQPVLAPGRWQSTVRTPFPPPIFVFNLSVPGLRLEDAVRRRPRMPLVQTNDSLQSSINLILGFPALILGSNLPVWTQLEYAIAMNPTIVLVSLGYTEACEAAASGDPGRIPTAAAFAADYERVLSGVKTRFAEVIVATVPDPLDTAWEAMKAAERQAEGQSGSPLDAEASTAIRARVAALNAEIARLAGRHGAAVADLHAWMREWRAAGINAGGTQLNAGYLGGIYNLSGFYPGFTGHAALANRVLAALNQRYGKQYAPYDLVAAARRDPAVRFRPAGGIR